MIGLKSESKHSTNQTERGQALILFVLSLAVLLGFVAMSIDVGLILHERRQLQNTADSAALAGVIELPGSTVLAESKAQEWAANNGIDLAEGDEIQITIADDDTSVTVQVTRETPFIFGRVLGLTAIDVSATATAQIGAPAALSGILPFGVLDSAINYDGTPTTMKYDATNPTNGNFGPIQVDGPGAAIHRETIKYGSETMVCGESQPTCVDPTVVTQTGNMVGSTRTGINFRLNNTTSSCDEFDEVLIADGNGGYDVQGQCNPWGGGTGSLRLVLIPIIDEFPNGSSQPVTILRFAALFITDMNQCTGNSCEITGIFVQTVADPTSNAKLGIYDDDSGVKFVRLVD